MKKITIKRARAKNFLSYGNAWQEIVFNSGLTLIQGFNVDTGKSNGSGKSSAIEIIPFALFGKTIKELPQSKIINWNNLSGCEVQLFFDVDGKEYVFHRGLKPNKFKVTCDGLDVVRSADIRAFQMQMEEEVIGMDFKTFKSLIYFSPNNTISILGTGKEQKRLFLESLFDLSEYSELLKLVNSKIKFFSDKVRDLESSKSLSEGLIEEKNKDLKNFILIDIKEAEKALNIATQKLDIILQSSNDVVVDEYEYSLIKSNLDDLLELRVSLQSTITEVKTKIKYIQKDIDGTDIKTIEDSAANILSEIKTLEDEISRNKDDVEAFTPRLTEIKSEIDDLNTKKVELEEEVIRLNQDIKLRKQLILTCKENIGVLENSNRLDGKSECPMCKSMVDHDHVASWYDREIKKENEEIAKHTLILDDLELQLSVISEQLKDIKDKGKSLVLEYKEKQSIVDANIDNYFALESLRKNLKMLPDIGKLKSDLREKEESIRSLKESLSNAIWKNDLNNEDIKAKEDKLQAIDDQRKKSDNHKNTVDLLRKDVDNARENLEKLRVMRAGQDEQIEIKKKEIDEHRANIVLYESDIKKLHKMLDHLNYMRVALKDENVKQFAISAQLPYLNHRANHYLSESGFPYTVSIDGWLDVIIRGMGTEDVGYNSLSGGETKAMDMAVQLACNDIAELQAKTVLGFAIYDEILDTSLDADGVQKLMEIVKVKQREDNSCVLCISHRDEIKDLDFDNTIMVHKQNGFSSIVN